jgi:hypothetical protein
MSRVRVGGRDMWTMMEAKGDGAWGKNILTYWITQSRIIYVLLQFPKAQKRDLQAKLVIHP